MHLIPRQLCPIPRTLSHSQTKHCMSHCSFLLLYSTLFHASLVLLPILGVTWILGFFVVGDSLYSQVVEWLFCIFTTLQGVMILVMHCIFNRAVRENSPALSPALSPGPSVALPLAPGPSVALAVPRPLCSPVPTPLYSPAPGPLQKLSRGLGTRVNFLHVK